MCHIVKQWIIEQASHSSAMLQKLEGAQLAVTAAERQVVASHHALRAAEASLQKNLAEVRVYERETMLARDSVRRTEECLRKLQETFRDRLEVPGKQAG